MTRLTRRSVRRADIGAPLPAHLPGCRPEPGDTVLLNTTAAHLGLGTGGCALVVAVPGRLPADPSGPGHVVKARYSPLQVVVLGVDEPDSAQHLSLAAADDLAGMPVVVADLHSALPAIAAAIAADRPGTCLLYTSDAAD